MDLRGVIFDLDGVLCHTDRYHYLAWKALADRLSLPFDEQTNNRLRGVGRMESLDIILSLGDGRYADAEKALMAEQKNEAYRSLLSDMEHGDLAEGAVETLSSLRALGLCLAIGSSSKNVPLIIERTDIGGWFDAVVDGNHITNPKPHPEVFLRAAHILALKPEQCIVVEDAHAGIQAAKDGGFLTVGIGAAAAIPGIDGSICNLLELVSFCRGL